MPDDPNPPIEHKDPPLFGAALLLIVLLLVFLGMVEGVRAIGGLGNEPVASAATTGASLNLSVFPDSMVCHGSGGGPASRVGHLLPQHDRSRSRHTARSRSRSSSTTRGALCTTTTSRSVSGTVGGVVTVNGKPITQIDPTNVGHTFTVQTPPGVKDQLFVNVPLAGTPSGTRTRAAASCVNRKPVPQAQRDRVPVQDRRPRPVRLALLRALRHRPRRRWPRRAGQLRRSDVDDRLHVRHPDGHVRRSSGMNNQHAIDSGSARTDWEMNR